MIHRPLSSKPLLLAAACQLLALPALAQEPPPPAADGAAGAVEEVIVTARRRAEDIQDTPISITAVSGQGLEARQTHDLGELDAFVPNLTVNSSAAFSGSSQTAAVFLRGIGQTDFTLNTDPAVGIYVDGVYISRAVGSLLDLVDVEQVEVLRGPQGTLFGKNTIGGAINITTRRPAFEFGANASLLVGSDAWRVFSADVTGPLSETLAGKLLARWERRDGYVRRLSDGRMLGDENSFDIRLGLLFEPTDALSVRLDADYTRSRENGTPLSLRQVNANALFPTIHNALMAPALAPTLGARAYYTDQYVNSDPFQNGGSYPVYSDADVWGVSVNAEYETGPLTVRSISAYRDVSSAFSRDGDGSPLQVQSTEDVFEYHQVSQEFQLLGSAADGRLDYIVGAFALREQGYNPNIVDFGFVRFIGESKVRNTSYAAFAQGTFKLTDQISVTAGTRYTDEQRRFDPHERVLEQRVVLPIPPFPPQAAILNGAPGQLLVAEDPVETGAQEWTPSLTLSFKPVETVLLYGSYSRGFKSGGFTQRIFPANLELGPSGPTGRLLGPPAFGPETATVYEAGFKLTGMDRRLRLNGAVFHTDYEDLQVTVQVGVAPTTQNAAAAGIDGAELELQFNPAGDLRLDLAAGYLDARYEQLDARVTGLTLASKLPGTSKWTLSGALSDRLELPGGATLAPRLDWSYRSRFFFDANNSVAEDGYQLVNVSVAWTPPGGRFEVMVFGKNLGDQLYAIHGESILDPAGFLHLAPARGREWGLRLKASF
jgi:iron complex outermembrane receptor protein